MSGIASITSRADAQESLLLDLDSLDPNMQYRWVFNVPLQIAKRTGQGYRLVSRSKDGVQTLLENEQKPDDYIYNGESVLMCCDQREYETRRSGSLQLAHDRLSFPKAEFTRRHRSSGARNSRILDDEGEDDE
jgi:hypothetical protein